MNLSDLLRGLNPQQGTAFSVVLNPSALPPLHPSTPLTAPADVSSPKAPEHEAKTALWLRDERTDGRVSILRQIKVKLPQ